MDTTVVRMTVSGHVLCAPEDWLLRSACSLSALRRWWPLLLAFIVGPVLSYFAIKAARHERARQKLLHAATSLEALNGRSPSPVDVVASCAPPGHKRAAKAAAKALMRHMQLDLRRTSVGDAVEALADTDEIAELVVPEAATPKPDGDVRAFFEEQRGKGSPPHRH